MMKKLLVGLAMLITAASAGSALAQDDAGSSQAPLPRILSSPIRLTPVIGASSFTTQENLDNLKFDQGFSGGIFADVGQGFYSFETGILALNSTHTNQGTTNSVSVNSWGIPLLARINFSGKPQETVFLKAGAMPFQATGQRADTRFDVMAVGGLGGNVPLGRNSSLLVDASYNQLFTQGGDLTDYKGVALLAGLSLNL